MKFGSLFSGIGGFDLGLERAGWKCKFQVEIDDYANKVLEKHWPCVKRFRDVREVGKHNLESVDLICAGFPCQPFSIAGKNLGEKDERNMWPETARIISELRPRFALLENVPNLLNHKYFGRILGDLAESGYDAEWQIISASSFGAPHRRERIWILAYSGCKHGQKRSEEFKELQEVSQNGKISDNDQRPNSMAYTTSKECKPSYFTQERQIARCDWWNTEPALHRVDNGTPRRVHRLRCLDNSVVPQIVEWIGKIILSPTMMVGGIKQPEML